MGSRCEAPKEGAQPKPDRVSYATGAGVTNPCQSRQCTVRRQPVEGIPLAPQSAMSTTTGWYSEGGPVMMLILLVGIAGIAVVIERLYVIVFRARHKGRPFIERVIQLVRSGKGDEA